MALAKKNMINSYEMQGMGLKVLVFGFKKNYATVIAGINFW